MKLVNDNKQIQLHNTSKPKMTFRNGRTWDTGFYSIEVDGSKVLIASDSTWGRYGYMALNGKWYKADIFELDTVKHGEVFKLERGNILK